MKKSYDLTALISAEDNLIKSIHIIELMKKPRNRSIQSIMDPLVEINNLVASSLGGVLPEECIFEDAPYPSCLHTDIVGEIRGYIQEANRFMDIINEIDAANPSDINRTLKGCLEEVEKALKSLDTELN